MFNTLNYKGNEHQNHTKIPSHPNHIGSHQEIKQQQMQECKVL
jgi:hypothetical protein